MELTLALASGSRNHVEPLPVPPGSPHSARSRRMLRACWGTTGTVLLMSSWRVWIDQDLCTGDGLCAEICPDIFEMHSDGLAYVKEADWVSALGPDQEPLLRMATGTAAVPDGMVADVVESAEECPGECIFIDPA